MDNYLISIILPVYNVAPFLPQAILSLKEQLIGFQNLQVILYNDCSTDESGRIIDEYAATYHNVMALHSQKDSGSAGRPRNEALPYATAPYIMYLDPDDYYAPYACRSLYRAIAGSDYDYVGGYFTCTYSDGHMVEQKDVPMPSQFVLPAQLDEALDSRSGFWAKIYKRQFIVENRIQFGDGIFGEDMVFSCKALLKARKISFIDENIVFYRIRQASNKSATFNTSKKSLTDLSTAYALIAMEFMAADQWNILDSIMRDSIDYHVRMLCEKCTPSYEECCTFIQAWEWVFYYAQINGIRFNYPISKTLLPIVLDKKYAEAAEKIMQEVKVNTGNSQEKGI